MNIESIFKFIFIFAEVLFLFNLMIVVHELGHFWAARWRGLVVEKFGIWFGKPLWKKSINGVEYSLGCIPFGGYVALPQMAPMEVIEGRAEGGLERAELPPIKPLDKIIVAVAGPLASFLLAVLFAFIVWGIGRPVSEGEGTTVIGHVFAESPAAQAGLQTGDKITKVDGHPVTRFGGMGTDAISWRVVRSEGDTIPIEVERGGQLLNFNVTPAKEEKSAFQRQSLRQIQIMPAQTPMVGRVLAGSPAAQAGFKPNDFILAVDGQKLYSPLGLGAYIKAQGTKPVELLVQRGTQQLTITVTPQIPLGMKEPKIGIEWDLTGRVTLVYPKPWEQIQSSVDSMINTLGAVISPKSDIKPQHLSGPAGIMRFYYIIFESDHAWRRALWFSVLFNINLAILNMLPIPVLDGGHVLMAVIEKLRGRPLSSRILEFVQTGCVVLVMGFLLYVTFFDVQDLPWRKQPAPAELIFAPTPANP